MFDFYYYCHSVHLNCLCVWRKKITTTTTTNCLYRFKLLNRFLSWLFSVVVQFLNYYRKHVCVVCVYHHYYKLFTILFSRKKTSPSSSSSSLIHNVFILYNFMFLFRTHLTSIYPKKNRIKYWRGYGHNKY